MTQPGCTKMALSQLLLAIGSSNLVGRKSKCYFIIKFSLLLSIKLRWIEIRPDIGKTIKNELGAFFSVKLLPRKMDSDKTLVLLMNRHAYLVAVHLTNTLS